jgi:hypothetical protein
MYHQLIPQEYAPTTLPSHLLALLTAPSARAIIIVIDEFDLFTEHARQALLYCLREFAFYLAIAIVQSDSVRFRVLIHPVDVVQSVKTGPVESTGRGIAVIGVTSRVVSVPFQTSRTIGRARATVRARRFLTRPNVVDKQLNVRL